MFLISRIALDFALGKHRAGRFVKDRVLRLMVPFLVGLLTHLRLQEYLAQVRQNQTGESFWQWYPSMFNGQEFLGG